MSSRNTYIAVGITCSTASMFGYGTGYIGGLMVLPSFNRYFLLDDVPNRVLDMAQSVLVSVWLFGALIGVVMAMPICASFGRRFCLASCAVTFILGGALQLIPCAGSLTVFSIGRTLNGIAVGAGTLVAPLYISEISRPSQRGALLGSWQVCIQISALCGFWIAYVSHLIFQDASDWQWRVPVIIQLCPGLTLLLGVMYLPESPAWLAEHCNPEALQNSLAWLRCQDPTSREVVLEAEERCRLATQRRTAEVRQWQPSIWQDFRCPSIRKRMICGVGLMSLMTMSGTNALNFFAPTVFRSAGFTSTSTSLFLTGVFGLVKLVASLCFMFYVVRHKGHRFWIILSTSACATALAILAFCVNSLHPVRQHALQFLLNDKLHASATGIVACLMVLMFAFFFGIGHGPIAWSFCAEVFPPHLSTKCCAITTCVQWVFQVLNAMITPWLITNLGWYTWLIFGVVNAFTLIWVILYLPETRSIPVGTQMDLVFGARIPKSSHESDASEEAAIMTEDTPLLKP